MDLREYKELTCKRCGICCHLKVLFLGKTYIDMSRPCKFLDLKTKQCTVYEERFEKQPHCQKLYVVLDNEWQPGSCGYVEELKAQGKKYRDPTIVDNFGAIREP